MTIHAKNKGNAYERAVVLVLRAHGFEAVTARVESKALDDAGVDIATNAPFNIQCKAVERLSPGYHDLLNEMPRDKTPLIFHKRNNKGTVVSMKLEDFNKLLLDVNS